MILENMEFLLDKEEPWTLYRTLKDLYDLDDNDLEVMSAKVLMLKHPLVQGLIKELNDWPGVVISSHKSAGQLYHKLEFLADIGLTKDDEGILNILEKVMAHPSEEGPFQLPVNIPVHFGGTGEETGAWALCDAPLLLYSLSRMGQKENDQVKKGFDYLINLSRENGWPCAVSKELGNFRGPGKKDDPCPYANLIMLKLITVYSENKNSNEAQAGVECLLHLWDKSRELHSYMFFMGDDFRKLKVPFIWYDILHVVDILSQYESAINDIRFKDMLQVINSKVDEKGMFTPESEWKAWKEWGFTSKRNPSKWLTFLVYRINKRVAYKA
jgi:hypothetical protein